MADPQQSEILRKGWLEWNRWRIENGVVEPDLSGANLSGADLNRADLNTAHLSGADLSGADLRWARLSGADLSWAGLSGATLSGADLCEAGLGWANLSGADLTEADLSLARLLATVIGDSNLTGAKGLETCKHLGPSILDHQTLTRSGQLPISFLRGCGLPDSLIEYLPSLLNQPVEFYSCFICYSHKDKAFARRLHDTLQGRGIRCWRDEKQLLPGDDTYDHVDRGIRLWDKVLLCCSKNSLTSWWVDDEIGKAFAKEQALMKERKTKIFVLIPPNLDGYLFDGWTNGKASQVRQRLASDFRGWERRDAKFEEEIEKVVKALRSDEHAREHPPNPKL